MKVCPACSAENPAQAKFCLECGTPLPEAAAAEVRKAVSILFTDLADSTALGEKVDPESLRRLMGRYFARMSEIIQAHGGTVEKFIGDAVMAVFGIPVLHEDDALRAVRAAHEMRRALGDLNVEFKRDFGTTIQNRTGVNSGEVVAGDASAGQTLVTGDAVNVAARLEQAAPPGEILIGYSTLELVRDAVDVEQVERLDLKGKSEKVDAYLLRDVAMTGMGFERRLDSPLVGRERELTILHDSFRRANEEARCHLVTVIAAAGTGKTRLLAEFAMQVGEDAEWRTGRCLAYGEGITYWPIAEIVKGFVDQGAGDLRTAVGVVVPDAAEADIVVQRLEAILGNATVVVSSDEIFWAVRKLFEGIARLRPAIFVLEDIHWAEPTLLDLIEYLAGWSTDAPLMLIATAREEMLETRPSLGIPRSNTTPLLVEPLAKADTERLVSTLLQDAELPRGLLEQIVEKAEGNPLYVEEMLRMFIDEGKLVKGVTGWIAAGGGRPLEMPPTIGALLAARLDRLEDAERSVLQRASVAGRTVWHGAIAHLTPATDRTPLATYLQSLVRRELMRPDRSTFPGEDAFRFSHALVRDAAYATSTKRVRAEMHERFADWLEGKVGDRLAEFEEILGFHLEQAHLLRRDLGEGTDDGSLADRAADLLWRSGQRAFAYSDMPAAVNLVQRVAGLAPPDSDLWVEANLVLAETLFEIGDLEKAGEVLRSLEDRTEQQSPSQRSRLKLQRVSLRLYTDESVTAHDLRTAAREVLVELEAQGDDRAVAKACELLAQAEWVELNFSEGERLIETALEHARKAGDGAQVNLLLRWRASFLLWGPTEVSVAKARCREMLADADHDRLVRGHCLLRLGVLEAMAGDFDEARRLIAQWRALLTQMGHDYQVAQACQEVGIIEMLAGDMTAAERELRSGYDFLAERDDQGFLPTVAALLAHVMIELDRLTEAEEFIAKSQEGLSDDVVNEALWRGATAKLRARQGDASAETFAREAVEKMASSDDLRGRGDAYVDLAEALELLGDGEGRRAALEEALDLYRQKGVVPAIQRVEEKLASA